MRVLVTGRGSIAQRHVRHLRELLPNVVLAVISGTGEVDDELLPCAVFENVNVALNWKPDAVVIASISSKHAYELELCLLLGLPCLVEKPIVTHGDQLVRLEEAYKHRAAFGAIVVGCNLRYLPALQKLKRLLSGALPCRVLRAHLEVGQALAQWRPSRDLKTTYSADESSGGGVVFDLVHEIDMAQWLLGPLQVHAAIGGRVSDLLIRSDDVHVALLKTLDGAPVVVSLDYFSQQAVRAYTIVTELGTYSVDIMGKRILLRTDKGNHVVTDDMQDFDIQRTYQLQMADWLRAIENPTHEVFSSFVEGIKSAQLMLSMKRAVQ